jgi:hypothetical protein
MRCRKWGNAVGGIMFVNDALGRIIRKAKEASSNQQKSEAEIEEKDSKKCSHHFGYLVKHPKNSPYPEECLLCTRLLECVVSK